MIRLMDKNVGWLVVLVFFSLSASMGKPPNVIVILADDLGYADVGFHDFEASKDVLTPNIDRLAAEGVRFGNGYVPFSTCGPSRASLLTGRSSSRFGVEENSTYPPLDEILIPRVLSKYGYISGAFGKWHLGEAKGQLPVDRGFDYYWGDIGANKDYFMKRLKDPPSWKQGVEQPRPYGRYVTDAYTDEAVQFIKRNKKSPMFVYLAYNAPHSPFRTYEALVKRVVEQRPQWKEVYDRMQSQGKFPAYDFGKFSGENLDQEILRLCYISMLLAADDGVGKIIQTLEEEGLRENTLIYFLSDNGAALARPNDLGGVNIPLRHGKGTVFDGGCRVPFVMNWKGVLPAGTESDLMVSSMDIYATAVAGAGGELPADRVIDGVDLMPFLTGKARGPAHESLFFRRKGRNAWSIRSGDFKWVWSPNKPKSEKPNDPFYGPESNPDGGLYDVQNNLSEDKDLSTQFPEKKQQLVELFERISTQLPEPMEPVE